MEKIIKTVDIERAIANAYEQFKSLSEGTIDPRACGDNVGKFGISVALANGKLINKGDTELPFCMASLSKIPLSAILLSQNGVDGMLKKSGNGCACEKKKDKPKVGLSVRGIFASSAVEPTGDPEGKWLVILDMLRALIGDAPVLNDKAYEAQLKVNEENNIENVLAEAPGFYLMDSAPIAIDTYSKLQSMMVTTRQLATMGATVAADGRNAVTGVPAFDPAIARHIVGMMAAHGIHHMNKAWLFRVGVPAKSSWGGGVLAVVPGLMAVAAYAPELNEAHVSVKASKAVAAVLKELDINLFAGDCYRNE